MADNSNLTLKGSTICNNSSSSGGGLYGRDGSRVNMMNVTIKKNKAESTGGGIFIGSDVSLQFSDTLYSNIYLNKALEKGADLYYEGENIITVSLDSFSVSHPDDYLLYPEEKINLAYLHCYFQSVDGDLYVSPDGLDTNTGTSPSFPLRSINSALLFLKSDSTKTHYIHLAPGLYSPSTTSEDFPLFGRSNIVLKGAEKNSVVLDGQGQYRLLQFKNVEKAKVEDLVMQNGYANHGAGIYAENSESIDFYGVEIRDNTAEYWASAVEISGNATFKNVLLANNEITRH